MTLPPPGVRVQVFWEATQGSVFIVRRDLRFDRYFARRNNRGLWSYGKKLRVYLVATYVPDRRTRAYTLILHFLIKSTEVDRDRSKAAAAWRKAWGGSLGCAPHDEGFVIIFSYTIYAYAHTWEAVEVKKPHDDEELLLNVFTSHIHVYMCICISTTHVHRRFPIFPYFCIRHIFLNDEINSSQRCFLRDSRNLSPSRLWVPVWFRAGLQMPLDLTVTVTVTVTVTATVTLCWLCISQVIRPISAHIQLQS